MKPLLFHSQRLRTFLDQNSLNRPWQLSTVVSHNEGVSRTNRPRNNGEQYESKNYAAHNSNTSIKCHMPGCIRFVIVYTR